MGRKVVSSPARVELVTFSAEDLPELARFVGAQTGASADQVQKHLQWFLLENPARDSQTPLGWGLRSPEGKLVGCLLNSPQRFRFQEETLLLMGSSMFYVDAAHRGAGGLLFLSYSRQRNQWTLFGSTANADAAQIWKARGATPLPNSDHELLAIVRWPPLLEEAVMRRSQSKAFSRLAGASLSPLASVVRRLQLGTGESGDLVPLTSAEQVMEIPVNRPAQVLTGARDLPFIRWRYFSGHDFTVGVFAFRCRQLDQEILVTTNMRVRGHRGQIRTLNVLDIYPDVPLEICRIITAALLSRYNGKFDALVLRGMDPARQKALCNAGFQRRPFDAPIGWFLPQSGSPARRSLYFVPADGDGII